MKDDLKNKMEDNLKKNEMEDDLIFCCWNTRIPQKQIEYKLSKKYKRWPQKKEKTSKKTKMEEDLQNNGKWSNQPKSC
jgi:hypothetical protein